MAFLTCIFDLMTLTIQQKNILHFYSNQMASPQFSTQNQVYSSPAPPFFLETSLLVLQLLFPAFNSSKHFPHCSPRCRVRVSLQALLIASSPPGALNLLLPRLRDTPRPESLSQRGVTCSSAQHLPLDLPNRWKDRIQ